MSKIKELNEEELRQVSGGLSTGGITDSEAIFELLKTFGDLLKKADEISKKHPEFKEELAKLINVVGDSCVSKAEKDRIKAEFRKKYVL